MRKTCYCAKRNEYSGKEAKKFFDNNIWRISHLVPKNRKILECNTCLAKWDFKYLNNNKDFVLTKKLKHPELVLGKVVSFWIEDPYPGITFENTKIIYVCDDDIKAILKIPFKWIYKNMPIQYFYIKSRHPGYLSDILWMDSIMVNVGYSSEIDEPIHQFKEENIKFQWIGTISI